MLTKDSGFRDRWPTGAQRDTQEGKADPTAVPLRELAGLIENRMGVNFLDSIDRTDPPLVGMLPEDETRPDLIPELFLNRLAGLLHRGALKYDDNNWKKGIPLDRVTASLMRHLFQWMAGDTSEDHLAAVAWNAMALMWMEDAIDRGELPQSLVDLYGQLSEWEPEDR